MAWPILEAMVEIRKKNRLFFGGNEKKKICFRHFLTFKGCPNSNEENGQEQEIHRETPLVTVAEFIQNFRATINLEEESEYVESNKNLLCHWKKRL